MKFIKLTLHRTYAKTQLKHLMALLLVSFTCSNIQANDRHLQISTIPASACEPRNGPNDASVRMSRGAWVFANDEVGEAILFCPLPLSGLGIQTGVIPGVGGGEDFHYLYPGGNVDMSRYRVYYRDNDGIGLDNEIQVRFAYRNATQRRFVGEWWSSNNTGVNETGNRREIVNLGHGLSQNRIYLFYVQMVRDSEDLSPAFTGIDFPPNDPAG